MASFKFNDRGASAVIRFPGGDGARSTRASRWARLFVAFALAGCGVGCSGTDTHRPYTFTFVKSGGLMGLQDELVVDSATKQLTFRSRDGERRTAEATETDLKALEDKLQQADFMNLEGPYRCLNCADQFLYDATVTVERSKAHTVHWEDGSSAPVGLTALGAQSEKLIHEKFPLEIPAASRATMVSPAAVTQ